MPDVIIIIALSTIILKFKEPFEKGLQNLHKPLTKINLKYTAILFQRNLEVTSMRFHIKDNAILHTT